MRKNERKLVVNSSRFEKKQTPNEKLKENGNIKIFPRDRIHFYESEGILGLYNNSSGGK
jgi:hypothetical protein